MNVEENDLLVYKYTCRVSNYLFWRRVGNGKNRLVFADVYAFQAPFDILCFSSPFFSVHGVIEIIPNVKMDRINARFNITTMADHHPIGDFSTVDSPAYPVRPVGLFVDLEYAIICSWDAIGENPTMSQIRPDDWAISIHE